MEPSPRIDVRAAARRLGVSVYTVLRWIRRGLLPAVKVGGYRYLIDPGDLDRPFVPVQVQRTGGGAP